MLFQKTVRLTILAYLAIKVYIYARNWTEIAHIGTFTLHITDLVFLFITAQWIPGSATRRNYSIWDIALFGLCGLMIFGLLRGITAVGLTAAGNAFRSSADFVAITVFLRLWY